MLKWAVIFLIIALIAGVLGFTDVQIVSAGIAKVLFAIFLIGFLLIVLFGFVLGSKVAASSEDARPAHPARASSAYAYAVVGKRDFCLPEQARPSRPGLSLFGPFRDTK